MLFRRVVIYALLIGAASGALWTVAQFWQVIPIIQKAEQFEGHHALPVDDGHPDHDHAAEAWAPGDGVERTFYTLVANVLTAVGLAMVLLVAVVATLRVRPGTRVDWRYGLLWGAAGYVVFFLAPALGLPPEIPGATAAPLQERQLWWLMTVTLTAAGLAGVAFGKTPWRWAALGLLAVPHLIGAPEPPALFGGQSPSAVAELTKLARQFIGATALANAVLWLALGLASVWAARRIVSTSE